MDDIAKRYSPLMRAIAETCIGAPALAAYVSKLEVVREAWDTSQEGGHFYFEDSGGRAETEIVDAVAEDADGAPIMITLHLVGAGGDWAEWYRWDGKRVVRWPPSSAKAPSAAGGADS